ncbi:sigma 54-interacting transcriptional regulator [uncultured Roseibium sp.]|uniref:sigma 54-interacting transcriptional regulator n=1 Tax=uncultured Roseibium sp. TaxID=1936171 RepID=UPI0032167CB4
MEGGLRSMSAPSILVDFKTNEQWHAALDSIEAAVIVIDPYEDRILQFNDAALRLTGMRGYGLGGMAPSRLFPDQLPAFTGLSLECLHTGSAWSTSLAIAVKEGEPKPVELYLSTYSEGDRKRIVMTFFDLRLVKMRRAETEVLQFYRNRQAPVREIDDVFRQLERGNQLILHAAGEGIYGVDAEGLTTFLNPAAERMLGWRAEELIGQAAHGIFHHSHEDGTGYAIKACPIYAAFRDGLVHRVTDEVFWRRDGSCFPVEYTSTPIQEKGKLLGAVVVFRDVSEQRKGQQDLLNALDEVERLRHRLELENAYLQEELSEDYAHREIVGNSQAVKHVLRQIELVAPSNASVLITGESGTGKELIARAIHDASPRRNRPLIRVNCASIPRELFESEFFGHAKGAFTGAVSERVGRFELADGGTIFLDEIGELPPEHQSKLLRILQEQQFERVGETRTRDVDVRVIAATNRDLQAEVQQKVFREDLYFRLNVFPIELPPLRERLEDIPLLASLFLKRASSRLNKPGLQISLGDAERLQGYHWPGNIRELENVIERAVITATDGRLRLHVPVTISIPAEPEVETDLLEPAPSRKILTEADRLDMERAALEEALRTCKGRVSGPNGAAKLMGVKPTTLYSRLQRYGINAKAFKL